MDNLAYTESGLPNGGTAKDNELPIPVRNNHRIAPTATLGQHGTQEKENNQRSRAAKYVLLRCLDAVIIGVVIAPLVVSYFRGTWYLLNTFLLPDNFGLSAGVSLVIGVILTLLINLLQGAMASLFPERTVIFHIVYRVYIYVYGFAVINQFRGLWYVLDHLTGVNVPSACVCLGVALLVFVLLRGVGNIAGSPMITNVDISQQPFRITTRLEAEVSWTWKFVGDVVLTVGVIVSTVIVLWRGVWSLFDFYIFPSDTILSAWLSLGIGYFIYVTVLVLESATASLVRKAQGLYARLIVECTYNFVSGMGSVAVWRGLWMICDAYVLPDSPVVSYWVTHVVGIAGLFFLLAGRSALVTGCIVDGKKDGSGVRLGRYLEHICPKLVQRFTSTEYNDGTGPVLPTPDVEYEETRL